MNLSPLSRWWQGFALPGKLVLIAASALFVLVVALGIRSALIGNAKVETRLARNQAEAATQSGSDAVETVGRQQSAEVATDTITKENDHAIRSAQGADAPVAPAAAAAGRASLCRRAAYRERPECVQHAPAR